MLRLVGIVSPRPMPYLIKGQPPIPDVQNNYSEK